MKHNLSNKPTLEVFPLPTPVSISDVCHILTDYEDFIRRTFEHNEAMRKDLEHLREYLLKHEPNNNFVNGRITQIDEVLGK